MRKSIFTFALLVFTLFSINQVFAHPGHGDPKHQEGILHYLTAPEHFIPVFLVLAALAFIVYKFGFVHRKKQSNESL